MARSRGAGGGRAALRALRPVRLRVHARERPAGPLRRAPRAGVAVRQARPCPRASKARRARRVGRRSRPVRHGRVRGQRALRALPGLPQPRPDHLRPARHRQVRPPALPGARARRTCWMRGRPRAAAPPGSGRAGPSIRAATARRTSRRSGSRSATSASPCSARPTAPRSRSATRSPIPEASSGSCSTRWSRRRGRTRSISTRSRPCRACCGRSAERDAGGSLPTRSPTWRHSCGGSPAGRCAGPWSEGAERFGAPLSDERTCSSFGRGRPQSRPASGVPGRRARRARR